MIGIGVLIAILLQTINAPPPIDLDQADIESLSLSKYGSSDERSQNESRAKLIAAVIKMHQSDFSSNPHEDDFDDLFKRNMESSLGWVKPTEKIRRDEAKFWHERVQEYVSQETYSLVREYCSSLKKNEQPNKPKSKKKGKEKDMLEPLTKRALNPAVEVLVGNSKDHILQEWTEELGKIFVEKRELAVEVSANVKSFLAHSVLGKASSTCFDAMVKSKEKLKPVGDISFAHSNDHIFNIVQSWIELNDYDFWLNIHKFAETYPLTRYQQLIMMNFIIYMTPKNSPTFSWEVNHKKTIIEELLETFKQNNFRTFPLYARIAMYDGVFPRSVAAHCIQLAIANTEYIDVNYYPPIHNLLHSSKMHLTEQLPPGMNLSGLLEPLRVELIDSGKSRYLKRPLLQEMEIYQRVVVPFTIPKGSLVVFFNGKWYITWTLIYNKKSNMVETFEHRMRSRKFNYPNILLVRSLTKVAETFATYQEKVTLDYDQHVAITNAISLRNKYQYFDIYDAAKIAATYFFSPQGLEKVIPPEVDSFPSLEDLIGTLLLETIKHIVTLNVFNALPFLSLCQTFYLLIISRSDRSILGQTIKDHIEMLNEAYKNLIHYRMKSIRLNRYAMQSSSFETSFTKEKYLFGYYAILSTVPYMRQIEIHLTDDEKARIPTQFLEKMERDLPRGWFYFDSKGFMSNDQMVCSQAAHHLATTFTENYKMMIVKNEINPYYNAGMDVLKHMLSYLTADEVEQLFPSNDSEAENTSEKLILANESLSKEVEEEQEKE